MHKLNARNLYFFYQSYCKNNLLANSGRLNIEKQLSKYDYNNYGKIYFFYINQFQGIIKDGGLQFHSAYKI